MSIAYFSSILFYRVAIGSMICTLPSGVLVILLSFIAVRVAVEKKFPGNDKEDEKVTLNYGIVSIIVFLVLCFFLIYRQSESVATFAALSAPILHLIMFNGIAIYFISNRPSLKAFAKSKLFLSNHFCQNTVHVENFDV